MILVFCIVMGIVFTAIGVILRDKWSTLLELTFAVSVVMAIIAWIAAIILCFAAIDTVVGAKGKLAAKQEIYNALVYQLENNVYDNDNDIGKRDLYEQITEWNSDLARGKEMQHDFWYGILYPDIYDNLKFIELDRNQ